MRRRALAAFLPLCILLSSALSAQRPPDTVFLEDFTWDELLERMRSGTTTVIIGTAGTEQKGPHMVMGEHRYVLTYTAEKIARDLGNAVVAPIITYVPEGSWENPRGHMAMAGTITLPEDRFVLLLEHAARSLKAGGFRDILLIGDSGGNQEGMRAVAASLNQEWRGSGARAHFIGDYYAKSSADVRRHLTETRGFAAADVGTHAGMVDTSELMFVNPALVRMDKRAPGGGFAGSGVSGDPTLATAAIGEEILRIKIANALAQIRASMAANRGGEGEARP